MAETYSSRILLNASVITDGRHLSFTENGWVFRPGNEGHELSARIGAGGKSATTLRVCFG